MARKMFINYVKINPRLTFGRFLENLDKPKYNFQKVGAKF